MIACDASCARCGGATIELIGYDTSEVLDHEPAKWFVRVTKREKRACGKCSEVRMAELAPRIVEKGLASDRVVIETVVAKYCDHFRCTGRRRCWSAKRAWRFRAPRWMAG